MSRFKLADTRHSDSETESDSMSSTILRDRFLEDEVYKSVIGPTNAKFDSGYGSMLDAVSESNEQDDDTRSIRSILTNVSRVLPPQEEEHLISAFAGDLCQDIGFRGDLDDARDRVSARLPDLLKAFTLRLEENSKTERDAKEFVRQQRE